jgi:tetratricopeptide (TPR) repeat protein
MEQTFKEANAAFESGNYQEAADRYRSLEKLGVHSDTLFYNMGVVSARLGNIGTAVLYFEKVLLDKPGDEAAAFNLKVLRNYVARRSNALGRDADLVPAAGPWRATLDKFSPATASVSFLIFYLAFFAVLILRRFMKTDIAVMSLRVAAGIFLIVALLLGAVTIGKRNQILNLKEAVVVQVDSEGYQLDVFDGPGGSVRRFGLEEGARVREPGRRNQWTKIQDDQGRDGWVEASSVRRI